MRQFIPCSGQNPSWTKRKNGWAIRRVDQTPMWWRAYDKAGSLRTFPNYESAERAALKMESD